MPKFRKRPVIIEAVRFTSEEKDRAFHFITCNRIPAFDKEHQPIIKIQTLEGIMVASLGDWIIKGIRGEFYPCKPDIFKATYEEIE